MIVLEYAGNKIELKNPALPERVMRPKVRLLRTMAGTLRTYKQSPCKMQISLQIIMLSTEKVDELIAFMRVSSGKIVKLTYLELSTDTDPLVLESKNGYILTNPLNIGDDTRYSKTTTLLFEYEV